MFKRHFQRMKSRWARRVDRWAASHIPPDAGYVFTADYLSLHLANWEAFLAEFRGKDQVRFLEIGSYEGRSAIWLLENILTHPTATLVCLDIFTRNRELRFDHNIRVSGAASKVTKMKARSEAVLATLPPESFDCIYVDGSHQALNVLMDGVASWLLLKPRGIMIFDDYLWQIDDPPVTRPQMAIDLFLAAFNDRLTLLHKDRQVIVRKLASRVDNAPPN